MVGKDGRRSGAGKRRSDNHTFRRRHRKTYLALVTAAVVCSLGIGVTGAYAYMLNKQLSNVDKVGVNAKLKDEDRPDPDKGRALNILLLGSDKGEKVPGASAKTTLAEDAKASTWPAGKYRSDTLMIVHITADRKSTYLTSIPRDTFTTIYDEKGRPHGQQKINAAFSEYGAVGAVSTVEHLTNLRMKHVAIIDWAGFKELSTAVGGVPVHIPRDTYDDSQHVMWKAGDYNLEGKKALQYVRQRHGLLRGDFDRIARQQNFLRALMNKMLSKGVTRNPVKLINTVKALTENLTVDEDWSGGDMRGLALSLRGMQGEDVSFLSAPVAGTETVPVYGSIVRLDETKSKQLFSALREDNLDSYLAQYPDDVLKPPDQVG